MLVYVSGRYSADKNLSAAQQIIQTQEHIELAGRVAAELWDLGHAVICPHTNTSQFLVPTRATYRQIMKGDLMMVARCDAIVMLPNWKASNGATEEFEYAKKLGVPVYYYPDLPSLHPTEVRSPVQCQAFYETINQMYRTHLSKNHDYSPANILGPGEVGASVRLWDKAVRLANLNGIQLNLQDIVFDNQPVSFQPLIWKLLVDVIGLINTLGFKFKISKVIIGKAKEAKHESIDDTLMDLAVYAIIQRLLMANQWGH
jgi:hypothetical protein